MSTKEHGLKGRQSNRWKGKGAEKTARLQQRCLPEDKAAWKAAAERSNMTESEWVIATLNAAAKNVKPE